MNRIEGIAIVIPAYKDEFFGQTLASLASQTCSDFNVYVGDDASPYDIKGVCDSFRDRLNIVYHRFEENLGGLDLVAQWQRCLELVDDEEWVCLFSDDDIMEPRCIESFNELNIEANVDVVHFNISIINENGEMLRECNPFPSRLSSQEFYRKLFRREIDARMPEFVFRKGKLHLVPFDLAWRTDTATVIQTSFPEGMVTIPDNAENRILWRASSKNVSGIRSLVDRKNNSNIDFFVWIRSFFKANGVANPIPWIYQLKTVVFSFEYLSLRDLWVSGRRLGRKYCSNHIIDVICFNLLLIYRLCYIIAKER